MPSHCAGGWRFQDMQGQCSADWVFCSLCSKKRRESRGAAQCDYEVADAAARYHSCEKERGL